MESNYCSAGADGAQARVACWTRLCLLTPMESPGSGSAVGPSLGLAPCPCHRVRVPGPKTPPVQMDNCASNTFLQPRELRHAPGGHEGFGQCWGQGQAGWDWHNLGQREVTLPMAGGIRGVCGLF